MRSMITLHRIDHWATYLPTLLWGVLVGATSLQELAGLHVIAALVSSTLVLTYGFALNSLCDVRSDLRSRVKSSSALAVRQLGVRVTKTAIAVEAIAALAISVVPGILSGSGYALPVVCIGALVVNTAYSAPPVRAKARSSLGPMVMSLKSGTFPGLFGLVATDSMTNIDAVVLLVAVTVSVASRGVWHAIPDIVPDAAAGVQTFSVVHGAVRSGYVSILLAATAATATLLTTVRLFGTPLGLLACAGMTVTVWFRLSAIWSGTPDDDQVIESVGSPSMERRNTRWNSATFTCLCAGALLHVLLY